MSELQVKKLTFNWFFGEYGDEFTTAEVGKMGVWRIEEHRPAGEGDRLWYDIYMDDGSMERIFNPNRVLYR